MEIRIVSIPKAELDKIPATEQAFYLHIGHLRNEIMVLHKLLWGTNYSPRNNEVQVAVALFQSLIITRLSAGKLWEGWELVKEAYFKTKVSQSIEAKLSTEAKEALQKLKTYFGRKNIIYLIRNQFAFHYSPQYIREQLNNIGDDQKLEVYIAEKMTNVFYQASEMIANGAMLDAVDQADSKAAIRKFMSEIMDVSDHFVAFCDGCIHYMLATYFLGGKTTLESRVVEMDNLPRVDELCVSFFLDGIKPPIGVT